MADVTAAQVRMMLQGYEQQLLAARRLARLRMRRRMAAGDDPNDPDPAARRHLMVEKVARELYEALLYTGSDNPVVEEIRQELGREVGQDVQFTYPPGGRLRIVGLGPDGLEPLSLKLFIHRRILPGQTAVGLGQRGDGGHIVGAQFKIKHRQILSLALAVG